MEKVEIEVTKEDGVILPEYATEFSSGVDLKARSLLALYSGQEEVSIKKLHSLDKGFFYLRAFERALIGTGIKIAAPEGYEFQIRPRSGKALKNGLLIANSPGTIDGDYRGEVGVIVINNTRFLQKIEFGERIAQAVLCPIAKIQWKPVEVLSETERGEGGFGHTGK